MKVLRLILAALLALAPLAPAAPAEFTNPKLKGTVDLSGATNKSTIRSDIGLAIGADVAAFDADLAAIAALATTSFGRSALTLADAAAGRTLFGLTIGTDVPSLSGGLVPPAQLGSGSSITTKFLRGDGTWQAIAGGGDALVANPLSQFAPTTSAQLREVLSDENGTGAFLTTNGSAAALTGLNGSAINTGTVPPANLGSGASITTKFLRGDSTWQTIAAGGDLLSTNNLSDVANAGTSRTNLGVAIGTNVQAFDADLSTYAGITPSANVQSLLGAATYTAARTLLAGGLTGKTLWVDSVNGVDGTGTTGREDLPFLTLGAAKTAASSGDTIIVLPGAYNERNLLKNGVNWHFHAGANVTYTGAADGSIFDDGSTGANTAIVCRISGNGKFIHAGSGATGSVNHAFIMVQSGSDITMDADLLSGTASAAGDTFGIYQAAGRVTLRAAKISSGTTEGAVWWEGGEMHIFAETITSTSALRCVRIGSAGTGNAWITANEIVSTAGTAIEVNGAASGSRVWIDAKEIKGVIRALNCIGGKSYIRAEKISVDGTGSPLQVVRFNGGNHWLNAQKITTLGGAIPIYDVLGSGTAEVDVQEIEVDSGSPTNLIQVGAGSLTVRCGRAVGNATTTNGIAVSGGTLNFTGSIDTSANSSGNPITKSGGTLNLGPSRLTAEATRDSITAGSAQTVALQGPVTATTAKNANISFLPNAGFNLNSGGTTTTTLDAVAATSFAGAGSGLTTLNASNLNSGTVPDARFPATLPAASGVNLTALNGTNIASGTVANARLTTAMRAGAIGITVDGAGSAISTGIKAYVSIPFDCTITSATILGDQSGSIVFDVWKDTYANYPPTVADTITAAAKPTVTTAIKSQDNTLTGWTTTLTAGDVLGVKVDSVSTFTRVNLILNTTK